MRRGALTLAFAAVVASCSGGRHGGAPTSTVTHGTIRVTAALAGAARALPADFFGVNGANFIRGTDPGDARLLASVRTLDPETIRVFAGTVANYWDWRTGSFVKHVELPKDLGTLPPAGMTLERWKALLGAAGAQPIFDLNIVTSTLPDQLDMLRTAAQMGFAIRRVELGNELYQNKPAYRTAFDSPSAYGKKAEEWTRAIKQAFPGVEVAVVGALAQQGQRATSRKTSWNGQVLDEAHGADAITMHLYFAPDPGSEKTIDEGVATRVVAATSDRLKLFRDTDLGAVPPGKTCWVTEFNMLEKSSHVPGTWLHGLVVAQVAIGLATEPRVGAAVLHALVGNPTLGAISADPYDLTASGQAMRLVFAASRDASSAQALSFGTSELAGVAFASASGQRLLIANLGARTATVALSGLVPSGLPVATASAAPGARVTGTRDLKQTRETEAGTLLLPPWSLALVG